MEDNLLLGKATVSNTQPESTATLCQHSCRASTTCHPVSPQEVMQALWKHRRSENGHSSTYPLKKAITLAFPLEMQAAALPFSLNGHLCSTVC